jgi:hypothetical protein
MPAFGKQVRRLFVLIEEGNIKGVFPSWEAAEVFADSNAISLEYLLEFQTRAECPDHLHLLSAFLHNRWEFVGQWSSVPPVWKTIPEKVRLDHYRREGEDFLPFRSIEFPWVPTLLVTVNPMAAEPPTGKVTLLSKTQPAPEKEADTTSEVAPQEPEVEKSAEEMPPPLESAAPSPQPADPIERKPIMEDTPPLATQPPASNKIKPVLKKEPLSNSEAAPSPDAGKARKKLKLRQPLSPRGKPASTPIKPIPVMAPTAPMVAPKAPTPRAQRDASQPPDSAPTPVAEADAPLSAEGSAGEQEPVGTETMTFHAFPFLIALIAFIAGWAVGLFLAFKPTPSANSIAAHSQFLSTAEVTPIEPDILFFERTVPPQFQADWIRELDLKPIEFSQSVPLPYAFALDNWVASLRSATPPASLAQVETALAQMTRRTSYGFFNQQDDTTLVLDLEANVLAGWIRARDLEDLTASLPDKGD